MCFEYGTNNSITRNGFSKNCQQDDMRLYKENHFIVSYAGTLNFWELVREAGNYLFQHTMKDTCMRNDVAEVLCLSLDYRHEACKGNSIVWSSWYRKDFNGTVSRVMTQFFICIKVIVHEGSENGMI